MKTNLFILNLSCKKLAILVLMAAVTFGAFATLGGNSANKGKKNKAILSIRNSDKPGTFSLHSGYNFRGNQVIKADESRCLNLNTLATFHQGRTTYVLPMKAKVAFGGKLTFNPNSATR